ncbi:hypothetical protein AB6A40_002412 [Gnathostoma spinigerum]|uniref:MARVEL domain-containing protein n=1 Tax=Gnathostoma spinigerum TaxID=75299 RepID=A0ABD6EFL2_9BILA
MISRVSEANFGKCLTNPPTDNDGPVLKRCFFSDLLFHQIALIWVTTMVAAKPMLRVTLSVLGIIDIVAAIVLATGAYILYDHETPQPGVLLFVSASILFFSLIILCCLLLFVLVRGHSRSIFATVLASLVSCIAAAATATFTVISWTPSNNESSRGMAKFVFDNKTVVSIVIGIFGGILLVEALMLVAYRRILLIQRASESKVRRKATPYNPQRIHIS